jgi:hypothetical protein
LCFKFDDNFDSDFIMFNGQQPIPNVIGGSSQSALVRQDAVQIPRMRRQIRPTFHVLLPCPPSELCMGGRYDVTTDAYDQWVAACVSRVIATGQKSLRGPLCLAVQFPPSSSSWPKENSNMAISGLITVAIESGICKSDGSIRDVSARYCLEHCSTLTIFAHTGDDTPH